MIDVAGWRRWAFPFVVIGSNALLAYVLDPIVDPITRLSAWYVPNRLSTPDVHLLSVTLEIVLLWLFLWLLYRHRLFFRA